MRLGIVVSDTWHFFNEISEVLQKEFDTLTFSETVINTPFLHTRVNRWRLHRDLDELMEKVDVAFFEWASVYLVAASWRPKQCKIITRLHRYEMFKWADKINWHNVDKVILVSSGMEQVFSERFPEHADKAIVIPGGISLDRFDSHFSPFRGNVGTLCHLTPRKRPYELIMVCAELVEQGYDLRLHIGGGKQELYGDYYRALHHLVKLTNMEDRVEFHGAVKSSDISRWYKNIDIFISNSYSEGLQVAPMEAIASGCYVLSHAWEGCEDLFPPEDVFVSDSEMKDRIIGYIQMSDELRSRKREKQYQIVMNCCDIHSVASQITKLIQSMD